MEALNDLIKSEALARRHTTESKDFGLSSIAATTGQEEPSERNAEDVQNDNLQLPVPIARTQQLLEKTRSLRGSIEEPSEISKSCSKLESMLDGELSPPPKDKNQHLDADQDVDEVAEPAATYPLPDRATWSPAPGIISASGQSTSHEYLNPAASQGRKNNGNIVSHNYAHLQFEGGSMFGDVYIDYASVLFAGLKAVSDEVPDQAAMKHLQVRSSRVSRC